MKKSIVITLILILAGVLVACTAMSGQNGTPSGAPGGEPASGAGAPNGAPGQAKSGSSTAQAQTLPIDSVVGIGIIKLEGTDNAIDKDTAANILPLFKALKALSTNSNTSVAEISALNKQIKNTLTADQLTAIENLKITSSDVNKLLKENGLASSGSTSGSGSSGNRNSGGFGGPPDGGFNQLASGNTGSSSSAVKATPNAVAALTTSRKSAGGYNLTFADVIIKILEAKTAK